MSQDDQRNVPNEEPGAAERRQPAEAEQRAAAAREAAGPSQAAEPAQAGGSPQAAEPVPAMPAAESGAERQPSTEQGARETAATGSTAAAARDTASRREFREQGDGAQRYAAPGEQSPQSGSEQSWSAQPHPGYQPDPARRGTTKGLLISSLVGLVVLAAGAFAGYGILAAKSSNGFGAAPWTASVQQNGAGVGGINAQNNGAAQPVELPQGVTYGSVGSAPEQALNNAIASCAPATAVTVPVTDAVGTTAAIGDWALHNNPTVKSLNQDAVNLQTAMNNGTAVTVATAASALCATYPSVGAVPLMPDAVGSHAWSSAVKAFYTAATDSLRGVSGNPDASAAAIDNLNLGFKQLGVLSSRLIGAA